MSFIKNPKSKSDLIDRLLSQAFTGDLRDLGEDPKEVEISRPKPHMISIKFAGMEFLLAAHKPKPEKARIAARKAWQARLAGKPARSTAPVLPKGEAKGGLGKYPESKRSARRR